MKLEGNKALYSQFKEWNENIETCVNTYDYKASAIIYREAEQYCMGGQTLEDTVKYTKSSIKHIKENNLDSSWYYMRKNNLDSSWDH